MNENSIPFYKYFLKFLNIGTFALTLLQTFVCTGELTTPASSISYALSLD